MYQQQIPVQDQRQTIILKQIVVLEIHAVHWHPAKQLQILLVHSMFRLQIHQMRNAQIQQVLSQERVASQKMQQDLNVLLIILSYPHSDNLIVIYVGQVGLKIMELNLS